MTTRLSEPTTATDPVVRWVVIVTMAVTMVGVLALVRATAGDRVGLGEAKPGALATFREVPDIGASWTIVATYGGQEVHRQTLARTDLADRNWTVTIPATATAALERAGYL